MDTLTKLGILAEAARFDAACTSSGADRAPRAGMLGKASPAGCCHTFTPDGRCITLLKVLMSNACSYDCAYCVNRRGASCPRATFTPRELADLTVDFYKRNYIEGLFLSSGVMGTPDETSERMIACLELLRGEYRFNGYIHVKVIPGTDAELIARMGRLADRMSVNLELPSAKSLVELCPDKDRSSVLSPMAQIADTRRKEERLLGGRRRKYLPDDMAAQDAAASGASTGAQAAALADPEATGGAGLGSRSKAKAFPSASGASAGATPPARRPAARDVDQGLRVFTNGQALTTMKHSTVAARRRAFAPAGQATQLIIGATPEDDNQILRLSQALYQRFDLKRVFFSAYMPMLDDDRLPEPGTPVPLRREHRLYQADWLMRYYAFTPDELATPDKPWLDLDIDPKLAWALAHMERFPVEVMEASLEDLLRVPGIGPVGARRIIAARRTKILDFDDLKRLKITLKRARHFLVCAGRRDKDAQPDPDVLRKLALEDARKSSYGKARRQAEGQLSLF